MKTKILIFALIILAGYSYGQEKVISGKSKVKKLFVEQEETKKLLPSLEIKEQAFSDKNSNQIIDAYETSEITFKIVNSGEGSATGVQVKISLTNTDIKGLTFDETTYVGDIQANESKDIIIPIIATKEVQTGSVLFNIEVLEKNGLDAHPLAMRIETQKYTPEVTVVEGIKQEEEVIPETTYRGVGDPLKGLNVSKERSEMIIGDYFALIIGIDDYSGIWTPLNNAVHDAKAIKEMLESKYKFEYIRTLYNRLATRQEIIRQLEWLARTVTEDDNVFIYYSGHGDFKKEYNKGYWVPVDATEESTYQYVSNNDLQTFLSAIKSKHTLLISDACFSGDIFRGKTISIPFEDTERYYRDVNEKLSRQAITSGGIEPVMDGGREGHSVFAYYLLKSLRNNNKRFFDAFTLYNDLRIPVVNNSVQSPIFQPIKNTGDEGGQFLFIKKDF
ncbi:MAG: caspase family protein [Bacteroidales bacterium]|nr:caspase family protein [Bacteroidales bacterium]